MGDLFGRGGRLVCCSCAPLFSCTPLDRSDARAVRAVADAEVTVVVLEKGVVTSRKEEEKWATEMARYPGGYCETYKCWRVDPPKVGASLFVDLRSADRTAQFWRDVTWHQARGKKLIFDDRQICTGFEAVVDGGAEASPHTCTLMCAGVGRWRMPPGWSPLLPASEPQLPASPHRPPVPVTPAMSSTPGETEGHSPPANAPGEAPRPKPQDKTPEARRRGTGEPRECTLNKNYKDTDKVLWLMASKREQRLQWRDDASKGRRQTATSVRLGEDVQAKLPEDNEAVLSDAAVLIDALQLEREVEATQQSRGKMTALSLEWGARQPQQEARAGAMAKAANKVPLAPTLATFLQSPISLCV